MGVGKEGTGWDGIERKNLKRVKEEIVRAEKVCESRSVKFLSMRVYARW